MGEAASDDELPPLRRYDYLDDASWDRWCDDSRDGMTPNPSDRQIKTAKIACLSVTCFLLFIFVALVIQVF